MSVIGFRQLAGAALLASSLGPAHAQGPSPVDGRLWTLEDIVTVPEIGDIRIAEDGGIALYVARSADIARNRDMAELRAVDLGARSQRVLLRAPVIEKLRAIPGTSDWSALLNIGEGVQLYRIDAAGAISPILVREHRPLVGHADGAVPTLEFHAPREVGVLSYNWSRDGRWLFYTAVRRTDGPPAIRFDTEALAEEDLRRPGVSAMIELHVREIGSGSDTLIAERPTSDRVSTYLGGNVSWAGSEVSYIVEDKLADGTSRFTTHVFDAARSTARVVVGVASRPFDSRFAGPWGGSLETSGHGEMRQLVETLADGGQHRHGEVAFLINDDRSAGNWRSADGLQTIVGTRSLQRPGYGLAIVTRRTVTPIPSEESLTACDFTSDLGRGICVRESLNAPPELVEVLPSRLSIRPIAAVSPGHERIAPLRVTMERWINRFGLYATGFILWPRDYVAGQRYPAIVITHGSDADERFASPEMQWNYPAQLFAERGYIVLLINDPATAQNARIDAAYDQWISGEGSMTPQEIQDLIWLNGVAAFETAVADLVDRGIVDGTRVGIAGYSRGSQMTNVTMTQSAMFRAASSGDGGYLEPSAYRFISRSYDTVYGGDPFGPAIDNYRRLTPSLRASRASGPILIQMAGPWSGGMEFYQALRRSARPAELSFYPGETSASDETHIFHVPRNRLLAMRENLAWFDFWLRDRRDPDMPFPERLAIWETMSGAAAPETAGWE